MTNTVELLFYSEDWKLELLMRDTTASPEDMLLELEQRLESGDITPDELRQFIKDFSRRETKTRNAT